MFFMDPTFLLLIPPMLLAVYASNKVKSTFQEYSRYRSERGMTGREVARAMLDRAGLQEVDIERVEGRLSDHYDPREKVLRLSEGVYGSPSLAALGVAAHEAGHAVQDAHGYVPLKLRQFVAPAAAFGSNLGPIIAIVGIMLTFFTPWAGAALIAKIGIGIFAVATVFTVITLPVELNASKRALASLTEGGYVQPDERKHAKAVLDAAALTYMAAAFMAIMMLLRFVMLLAMAQRD
jgi:hypothetical protein